MRFAPLLLCTGCMSLDFMFLDAPKTDAYDLSSDLIDSALVDEVSFETADGVRLSGVWARQADPSPPLIYFHGTSGHIGDNWDRAEYYWGWGTHDVFLFDYRGFGTSDGDPSFEGVFEEDGRAAAAYVSEATGTEPGAIPWVALSLGVGVSLHTNDEVDAASLVLQSGFASSDFLVDDSTALDLPMGWFFEAPYDNVEAMTHTRSPVFVVHGLADDFIRPESGELLFEAAPGERELWQPEGVGHADLFELRPDEFRDRVGAFWADHP